MVAEDYDCQSDQWSEQLSGGNLVGRNFMIADCHSASGFFAARGFDFHRADRGDDYLTTIRIVKMRVFNSII